MTATNDYKLEQREGQDEPVLVRRFPKGGFVIRDSESMKQGEAYNADGVYLGFGSLEQCESAAQTGRIIDTMISDSNPLEDWLFWNACISAGTVVLVDEQGRQLIRTHSGVYLRVTDGEDGWDTEWLDETDIDEQYADPDEPTFRLTVCKTPFLVE